MYNTALMASQQMEDVGFKVDLQVVDWATLVKRRNNAKEYDVFTNAGPSAAFRGFGCRPPSTTSLGMSHLPPRPINTAAAWSRRASTIGSIRQRSRPSGTSSST